MRRRRTAWRGIAGGMMLAVLGSVGCSRGRVERVEWPTMGTIAAVQTRLSAGEDVSRWTLPRTVVRSCFDEVESMLNAHSPTSEVCRLAGLPDDAVLANCAPGMRPCYEAAFWLREVSGGAFNPRWQGTNRLDLGAIAKGFAVDLAADREALRQDGRPILLDLGGNLKAVGGDWQAGIRNPHGVGVLATVSLHAGEAMATSATYFRGRHIYDGRTGRPVTNGVAAVTVLCSSAMWADGLSTTLFILGPDEGEHFLRRHVRTLERIAPVSAVWSLDDGSLRIFGETSRFASATAGF